MSDLTNCVKRRQIRSDAVFMLAISHLEDQIAVFYREQEMRANRGSPSLKLKNLTSIFGR